MGAAAKLCGRASSGVPVAEVIQGMGASARVSPRLESTSAL